MWPLKLVLMVCHWHANAPVNEFSDEGKEGYEQGLSVLTC